MKNEQHLPTVDSVALSFVVDVLAYIFAAISPRKVTLAMLQTVLPLSIITTAIIPIVDPESFHFIINELSTVLATVGPGKLAHAVFLSLAVVTLEYSSVHPYLFALTMMHVVNPEAFIVRSVSVHVRPMAIRLVFLPVAKVHVTITMNKSTETFLIVV